MTANRVKDTRLQPVVDALRDYDTLLSSRLSAVETASGVIPGAGGEIGFDVVEDLVDEDASTYTVSVSRTSGSAGQTSVMLEDLGTGTATPGTDYVALPACTLLTWLDGEDGPKTFSLTLSNGSTSNVTVVLGLSALTGDSIAGVPVSLAVSSMTLTIRDVDQDLPLTIGVAGSPDLADASELEASQVLSNDVYIFLSEELPQGSMGLNISDPGLTSIEEWHYGDGTLGSQSALDALTNTDGSFIRDDPHFQGVSGGLPVPWATATSAPETGAGGSGGAEPVPTYGTVQGEDSSPTSVTPVIPTHAAGDFMFLWVGSKGAPVWGTAPSGWTLAGEASSGASRSSVKCYVRTASSASETNPTVTVTASTGDMAAQVIVYPSCGGLDVLSAVNGSWATNVASVPSVTTLTDNCNVLRLCIQDQQDTHTWASSTEKEDGNTPPLSRISYTTAEMSKATAGAVAAENVTRAGGSVAPAFVAFTAAFKPSHSGIVGTNTDGDHWVAVKVTHTRTGGPTSGTTIGRQVVLQNTVPPPPAETSTLVPTGKMSEMFGWYQGGNDNGVWCYSRKVQLGTPNLPIVHEMCAPSQGDIPLVNFTNLKDQLVSQLTDTRIGGTGAAMNRLISLQTYDDRDWTDATYTARTNTKNQGGSVVRVDQNAAAQAAAYQEIVDGDRDVTLAGLGSVLSTMLSATEYIYLQCPGQELSGSWQGHAPFAANVALHKQMFQHAYDSIMGELTASERLNVFWDWSHPKENSRDSTPADYYPGDDISPVSGRSYVDCHSINTYIDKATAAEHINPGGPFGGLANKDNIIAASSRTAVLNRVMERANWGAREQLEFAISKGKPVGMGEGSPGVGSASNPLRGAQWVGDDPDMTELWLQWWHDNVVLSSVGLWCFAPFGSNAGGVGSQFSSELPNAWNRMKQWLGSH